MDFSPKAYLGYLVDLGAYKNLVLAADVVFVFGSQLSTELTIYAVKRVESCFLVQTCDGVKWSLEVNVICFL